MGWGKQRKAGHDYHGQESWQKSTGDFGKVA